MYIHTLYVHVNVPAGGAEGGTGWQLPDGDVITYIYIYIYIYIWTDGVITFQTGSGQLG